MWTGHPISLLHVRLVVMHSTSCFPSFFSCPEFVVLTAFFVLNGCVLFMVCNRVSVSAGQLPYTPILEKCKLFAVSQPHLLAAS
jgi:hypothetical protein